MALGYRLTGSRAVHHTLGRETYLAPVSWPAGEWPVVNGNGTLAKDMTAPPCRNTRFQRLPCATISAPPPWA